mgnify:CR=1 FL=1
MERITTTIPQAEVDRQLQYCREIARMNADRGEAPLAFVDTYGCQQNEADSERIRGYLRQMGYDFTTDEEQARIIVLNTCAIREHAEQRVLGNLGALVHVKRRNPEQIICLCGCMAQEAHVAEKVRQSFRHVDLVFGPRRFMEIPGVYPHPADPAGRIFSNADDPGSIAEGIPVVRRQGQGVGVHHVWVQQLLFLLHRALCSGTGALPPAGGHPGRGAPAGGGGLSYITLLGRT